MKSLSDQADALGMGLVLITAFIASIFVLIALKAMASEMDYGRRCHALREETRVLRERQSERQRNLRPKQR